jgi:hypothetical protein
MKKKPSDLWYLVPIMFGLLGGLIAYAALKNDDDAKAANCLWIGIGITILLIAFFL